MNGTEQRAHTTRVQQLTAELATMEGLLHETARRVAQLEHDAGEQRRYVDAQDEERSAVLRRYVRSIEEELSWLKVRLSTHLWKMTVWARLRWIVRGR